MTFSYAGTNPPPSLAAGAGADPWLIFDYENNGDRTYEFVDGVISTRHFGADSSVKVIAGGFRVGEDDWGANPQDGLSILPAGESASVAVQYGLLDDSDGPVIVRLQPFGDKVARFDIGTSRQ